jgi:hypothetical protein
VRGRPGSTLKSQGFLRVATWNETSEQFDLDEEFVAGADDDDYDRFIDRVDRRKQAAAVKRGKAAWSKLEDVLAEKRLQKALKDVYDDL